MPAHDFARPKTSYRNLYAFRKAEAIYDLTYFFLQRHIPQSDRTYDQMLQAARSGSRTSPRGAPMPPHPPRWRSGSMVWRAAASTSC